MSGLYSKGFYWSLATYFCIKKKDLSIDSERSPARAEVQKDSTF